MNCISAAALSDEKMERILKLLDRLMKEAGEDRFITSQNSICVLMRPG